MKKKKIVKIGTQEGTSSCEVLGRDKFLNLSMEKFFEEPTLHVIMRDKPPFLHLCDKSQRQDFGACEVLDLANMGSFYTKKLAGTFCRDFRSAPSCMPTVKYCLPFGYHHSKTYRIYQIP